MGGGSGSGGVRRSSSLPSWFMVPEMRICPPGESPAFPNLARALCRVVVDLDAEGFQELDVLIAYF